MSTDGIRLALGTLTVLPVPAPRRVGQAQARTAMLLAPLVRAGLGAVAGLVGSVAAGRAGALVGATLAVASLAVGTRALHLDGLADTADGFGSGRRDGAALEVMRRSDIGPFGVATLVLVLLLDVACAAALLDAWDDRRAVATLAAAAAAGGTALAWATRRGVPAARPDGLGAAVAGSVPTAAAVAVTAATAGAAALAASLAAAAGVVVGTLVAVLLVRRALARWGGITGDVLGAAVEAATTAALLVAVLVGPAAGTWA